MSDSEDMAEFASIVERIERGEVSEIRMIYGPSDSSGLSVILLPTANSTEPACRAVRGGEGCCQTLTAACNNAFHSSMSHCIVSW
ncbi:Ubiquitin carboxyl-terminal hydrolase MINDY-3 [Dissostichus eleginoides]|uniref:Ubiquitin carboxyl-terminal hydrolase MINDY-3 n=1 Tax=Dissostichus eleginoides TaxID=100907 RepID=A0AAD9C3H3_DISEL|nr:Ubiquitin carboxyl-terminal hydrolase MINDY-3 [Dissostichus eleginoides]